jgi:hypothetical protein
MKLSETDKLIELRNRREFLLGQKTRLDGGTAIYLSITGTAVTTELSTARADSARSHLAGLIASEIADIEAELVGLSVTIE